VLAQGHTPAQPINKETSESNARPHTRMDFISESSMPELDRFVKRCSDHLIPNAQHVTLLHSAHITRANHALPQHWSEPAACARRAEMKLPKSRVSFQCSSKCRALMATSSCVASRMNRSQRPSNCARSKTSRERTESRDSYRSMQANTCRLVTRSNRAR
jgi:hypothetical protein